MYTYPLSGCCCFVEIFDSFDTGFSLSVGFSYGTVHDTCEGQNAQEEIFSLSPFFLKLPMPINIS